MFKIAYDKKITMVQGDTGVIKMRISNYELSQGDEVRFAIANKANPSILLCQHSDKKIVLEKQVTVFEKDGSARIVIYPYDTEYLQPGKYLYEIQVKTKDGRIDTVVPLTSFTLMDGSIQGEYGQTTPSKPEPTPSEIELRFKRLENEVIPELGTRITNVENDVDSIMTKVNADNLLLSRLGKKYVNMNDTYNSIQGMTYLENDVCVCAYSSDKTDNMVRLDKINIKSGNVIMSKEIVLGHANDLCYDGEFIYVTMAKDYTTNANAKIIFKLNPTNLTIVDTIQNPSTGLNSWGGVAYDNMTKQFFVTSFEEKNHCEIYDQNFRYIKTINLKQETYIETGYQVLSAHNGKLYQITINPEVIFEFDVDGNLLKVYNIDEYQGIYKTGEFQSLCFREDGRAYIRTVAKLSRLSNGIEQFWLTDLSTNVNNSNNRFSSSFGQRSDLMMVVDNTTEYYNSTGLITAPFNSLEEMILSLHAPEFQDEQLTVDIKSDFNTSNLYIIGCSNINIYCYHNKINAISLIGCNNINIYDYNVVGYMSNAQIAIDNSFVKLGGGKITKANTEHTTLIERSTVIADGTSLGISVENPIITLQKISTLTVTDRDNKVINGISKDNTSKLKTVRLLKGDMTKTNITLPTDLSNYANVELRYKFPRGSGCLKWIDKSVPPRCSLALTNTDGITVYDCWFTLSDNILSSENATRGVTLKETTYIYEEPDLLFDIAIWD